MKQLYTLAVCLLFISCARQNEALVVNQFQLRDQQSNGSEDPMVKMEKLRHLHGAVSMAERRERLGQYYTFHWQDPVGVDKGPVKLVFRYQQGATASLVKEMVHDAPSSQASGSSEFSVIGQDYFTNGKVIAWKASLERGGKTLATKQSYLWQ